MPGMSCQRQKSSVNLPGSPGALATSASGPGLARTASMAAAAAATSPGSRAERTQTTPSRANASASSAAIGHRLHRHSGHGTPGPPPLPLSISYRRLPGDPLSRVRRARSQPARRTLADAPVRRSRTRRHGGRPAAWRVPQGGRPPGRAGRGQLLQVRPHVGDQPGHPGDQGARVGEALQVTVGAVDDLTTDQQVSQLLRAAEADLKQVAPAAAGPPQASPGPVPGEDGLPLLGDELPPSRVLPDPRDRGRTRRQTTATAPGPATGPRQARAKPARRRLRRLRSALAA